MSRWNRGRSGSVAVPLDTLFRENSNCPSAARSAGTVGKWGITSFTSIRSSPYSVGTSTAKKPVQDQNSPLTVPALDSPAPPPKPKKFFKSRNDPPPGSGPELILPPPQADFITRRESAKATGRKHRGRSLSDDDDDCPDIDLPRLKPEKGKSGKGKATKAAKKEDAPTPHSPIKRYLVRNRDKVINYNEDRSNSPIPDMRHAAPSKAASTATTTTIPQVPLPKPSPSKVSPPKASPPKASPPLSSPTLVKPGLMSPKDGKPPPIVLRISKGTSRIVSTDSNEELIQSPHNESAHSHDDEEAASATSPPHHESLKIKIKCPKEKKKKEEGRVSKAQKRHSHKKSSDELPLASLIHHSKANHHETKPVEEEIKEEESIENIESELARINNSEPKEQINEEVRGGSSRRGRAMRNRPTINYTECDDTTESSKTPVVQPPNKWKHKKEHTKKSKKRSVSPQPEPGESPGVTETPVDEESKKLIEILSGGEKETSVPESVEKEKDQPIKLKINRKNSVVISATTPEQTSNSTPPSQPYEDEKPPSPEQMEIDQPIEQPTIITTVPPPFKSPDQQDEDKPSVKLVISKKKGAIFKSRSLVDDNNVSQLPARKRRHLYKHQWADDGKGNQTPLHTTNDLEEQEKRNVELDKLPEVLPRLDREHVTSVMCPKAVKDYYTVVRNVKKAHQIQEIGEFQEFNDDVEYILDALQVENPMSTRCLSAITLASKCTAAAFRMHVRAHGTVHKFFAALHDAASDQSLGLCTATVMFVLSQDKLNMDLDSESLELMLNLLESDVSHKDLLDDCGLSSTQLAKNKERVRELCAEIKAQGKAKHLDLDNITTGELALEALLSLMSRRSGARFKDQLRQRGGIAHVVRTLRECRNSLYAETLRRADRCLRVLENVTQNNTENQIYLVEGCGEDVVPMLHWYLTFCCQDPERMYASLAALKVILNISHCPAGTSAAGSCVATCCDLLVDARRIIPPNKEFEYTICVLLLLINLLQDNEDNMRIFLSLNVSTDTDDDIVCTRMPALELLVHLFYKRMEFARLAEENTDAILDGKKETEEDKKDDKQSVEDIAEETVAKLLAKAGSHMEHSMVMAYLAVCLGHVAKLYESRLRQYFAPPRKYKHLADALRKYYSFLTLTTTAEAASVAHIRSTEAMLQSLDALEQIDTTESDLPHDLSLHHH